MPDLNPPLTDFDKSLILEAPNTPDLKPFSVWSGENKLDESDAKSYVQYSDYLREGYLNNGSISPQDDYEISAALYSKLADFGIVDEEDIEAITATKETSFEEKLEYVHASMEGSELDWQTLSDYKAGAGVVSGGGTTEEYQLKIEGLKEQAEEIVSKRYNDVKRSLVESNQLPMAYVINEEGEKELLAGDAAENMTVAQAIKASKIGGVSFKDALIAQHLITPMDGLDINFSKYKKILEISDAITKLEETDSTISENIQGHIKQLAAADFKERHNSVVEVGDSIFSTVGRMMGDAVTMLGAESEENNQKKKRIYYASRRSSDQVVERITRKLNRLGADYNIKDVRDAYETVVIKKAANSNSIKIYQDPSKSGKNVFNTVLGPVLNSAVYKRKEDLINTLAATSTLSNDQKEQIIKQRGEVVKENFHNFSKLIANSRIGDKWIKELVASRQAGGDDLALYDKFLLDDENFSVVQDTFTGGLVSIVDSGASLLYLLPALAKVDWAQEGLANISQDSSDRRELAEMFGHQYGIKRDVGEAIAPLIVDIAATTLLSTFTAGLGGAAYLSAKTGAQFTAKGLLKGITSNALRVPIAKGGARTPAIEALAEKAAGVWIKEAAGKEGRDLTIKALTAYNTEVAVNFGRLVGTFVPAATRSSAMSYSSMYNQLRKDPSLTDDEAHDRALGFALTTGAITGIITSAFSLLGRGGVEDALLKGMTFRESKDLFKVMGNTGGITKVSIANAFEKVMKDSIKKHGFFKTVRNKFGKPILDEATEEGLDQLVNSFVEDVALNQDTPMLERMTQMWHAAAVGGILGAGVPALRAGASRLKVTPMDQLTQKIRMRDDFVGQVVVELKKTGSPLVAEQVRQIMMTRPKDRGALMPQEAPESPQRTQSTTFAELGQKENQEKLDALKLKGQELEAERVALEDDSTLPEEKEKRAEEIKIRGSRKAIHGVVEAETKLEISELEAASRIFEEGATIPELNIGGSDPEVFSVDLPPEVFIGSSLSGATPLEIESAFASIRNRKNISFVEGEEATLLNLSDLVGDSDVAAIDYTQEQENANAAQTEITGESRDNVASHNSRHPESEPTKSKRYSSRNPAGTLRFDDPPFKGPDAEERANKLIAFAVTNGFPANISHHVNFGLPVASDVSIKDDPFLKVSRKSLSEFIASAVYAAYPKLAPPKGATPHITDQPVKTYFDPVSGITVKKKVEGFVDASGNGIFDNDPITMIDMLKSGKLVKVPRSFNRAGLNPSIRIKDGVVIDVVGPTADGILIESKVHDVRHVASVEPNNARASHIESIPFKAVTLPAGVKDFDFTNGGPLNVDFSDTRNIKLRIARFTEELGKTDEDTNDRVQGRLNSDSGPLDEEFKAAALEAARQDFLLNAQLLGLREKLLGEPSTIVEEIVAQTGSRNIDEAAQRLLPLITVEFNADLTSAGVIGLFIEQKLQNNPDFANNAPPTFDTLLLQAANRFKVQQEAASSIRSQRAASTLPFDTDSEDLKTPKVADWVANFGRNPEGELASPEDIDAAVRGSIDTAIDAVNTDPALRSAINKIILEHVLDGTDPATAEMAQNANARDIFGIFISWISSGNGSTRESVTELMENLEGGVYPSSSEFKDALLLANLATHSDRNGYSDPEAVNEYRDLFNQATGKDIDTDQARNTMIALSKAVRTHLSRSNISASERAAITEQNEADIQRLGLESGNPDSVIKALKEVSKNSDNPSHKVVADLLLLDTDFINTVKFLLGSATGDIAGKYVKANNGSHTVFINVTSGNGRGLVNTLLEEYVHAFVSDKTSKTPAQIASGPKGMKTRINMLNTVLSNARTANAKQKKEDRAALAKEKKVDVSEIPPLTNALDSALENVTEFAAQFLLSEDVQQHVKGLMPPANKSPFFSRFLRSIIGLFPKTNESDIKKAAAALSEVIDVGRNTRKTTPTDPKALGANISNKALRSAPIESQKDAEEAAKIKQEQEQEQEQAQEQERDEQASKRSEERAAIEAKFLASVPKADRPRMGRIINYVMGIIPSGMGVKFTTDTGGSSAYVSPDESTIFVNPVELMKMAKDVKDISGRALIGVVINEELSHTASFNSLSKEELQRYIDSLSDSDYQDIAREYYANSSEVQLDAMIANLTSENPEKVALAKLQMAEEKLRMHLQKVTRGFTTEDDTQFWSSKPSLLRILKRYLTGVMNRWVYSRKKIGAAADVALNKMIIEMRAIEVGFVRQPTKMAFDTENPMDVFQMYGTVNQDFVGLASAPVEDAEYMAAVESGDVEAQQRMVDEAAKKAGFKVTAFRKDNVDGIEVYDPSKTSYGAVYFSEQEKTAERFGGVLRPVNKFYLKLENAATKEDTARGSSSDLTAEEVGALVEQGFDSVRGDVRNVKGATEIAVFNPNQIKSAEPVTKDESGAVIPLSQRFNEKKSNILYSAPVDADSASAAFPTSAYNTIYEGDEIPSGLSDNNKVAAYLREKAVEFWGVRVNEDGGTPKGDEETFLTPITAKSITPEQEAKIVEIATEEALQALAENGDNAADWYTTSVESAMAVASVIYPELSNVDLARGFKAFSSSKNPDLAADLVMKLALAITSQNLKVSENTRYADKQYKIFRETGKFDDSAVYGSKAAAIQSNLTLANLLIEKLGFDKGIEFIESDFTVKSLNQTLKKMGFEVKVAGTQGIEVQGAAIFGPKIGQGFLQNLRASVMKVAGKGYVPVTVDLWLRRTWGRWTGDSAGRGLTTELAAEFLTIAKGSKIMPTISDALVKKVAKTYAEIEAGETKAKPNKEHIDRANIALKGVKSLRVNNTGKDLTKRSAKNLSDNPDYQIALFEVGKFVNSIGEKAYNRTREPFPPEIIASIRKGDYDAVEIYSYLENRAAKFESSYKSKTGVVKKDAKMEFLRNFDGSEEIMEPKEVRGLKRPWQNVAKRVKESIKPVDSPSNLEREAISRVINKVRINLEAQGMTTTNADIQAILWYPEKDIWQKLQGGNADTLKMSYDQAYEDLAKKLGPEIYEKAIEARQEVVRRGRDRAARNGIPPQQGADGTVNRGTVENAETPQSGAGILSSAPTNRVASAPTGTGIDFSAVVDLLEIPLYELDMSKPKNFIARSITEMFAGHLPEAFRRLIQNRDAYKRATEKNVIAYKTVMDKLIVKTYGSYENAPMDIISRAQGYYSGNVVEEDVLNAIEDAYNKAYAAAEKGRKGKTITRGAAKTIKDEAFLTRERLINTAYDDAVKVREADRDSALRDLAVVSKDLAAHIIDVREKLIIPLQEQLVESGLATDIGIKISKTGGIYVTRSYRMFTDSSYLEKVRSDEAYAPQREAAIKFFVDNYLKQKKADLEKNEDMDAARAEIEAKKMLDRENLASPHQSFGQDALNAFLMRYQEGGRDSSASLGPKGYKMIEDNLKQRKDLPKEIRELLGEYGPETGIDLILKTYSTVAAIASQQAFLNQLKSYATRKEGKIMVTLEEKMATAESRQKYADFVPVRAGAPSKSDPLSGMFIRRDFQKDLDVTLKDSFVMDNADTAEKAVRAMFGIAANLTGKAMAAKTLGSIGFYMRNAVGNYLFGSAQGYFGYGEMTGAMAKGSWGAVTADTPFENSQNIIDPTITELIGLNVMGDELRAGVLRDLLNGKATPEGITKQIAELGEKTKLNKVTKSLAYIEKKAQDLSAALDAAYKVVYYNHELGVLKEAQEYDPEGLGSKTDMEIKRMAARKVVMTSQAYSQAPPAVAAFTKTPLGLVAAPFIRFKMEVPRIVINTFKLGMEERASGNDVLVARGNKRMASMTAMLAVGSAALPMIMAALSGIGDEEDEALRASMPWYLRGHTFFYWGKGKDLESWDLTYLNPFSLVVDPFLRAYEHIRSGEFTRAGAAFARGFILEQYLDDQILSGAVTNASNNINPSTGRAIWTSGADGPAEAGVKWLTYVAKEAYWPRIAKDFSKGSATGSLGGLAEALGEGALPVRKHEVDLTLNYSRYLRGLNERYNNVKGNFKELSRDTPMSDNTVRDIIEDNIEDRRLLNYELLRINKGFKSLGLSNGELVRGMLDMKLGKKRIGLMSVGYMDKPAISYTMEKLYDPKNSDYGPKRAQQIAKYWDPINRYIPIRPITESE